MKNKILKKLLFIIVLIFTLFSFDTSSNATTPVQYLNDLSYDVVLNEDGSVNVTEIWDIKLSHTKTLARNFDLDSSKYSGISDVHVSQILKDGSEISFNNFNKYAYHLPQNTFYALQTDDSHFEIAWGMNVSAVENHQYKISYKVNNAIKNYNDCSEFYWQFIGTSNGIAAYNFHGSIKLPTPVSSKDNLKVWGHGPLNGNIEIVDNSTIHFEVSKLSEGKMVEVRIITTENIFSKNTNIVNSNQLNKILKEEMKWTKSDFLTILFILLTILVIIIVFFTIFFVMRALKFWKILKELKNSRPKFDFTYFRDFPDQEATPAEAAFIYYLNTMPKSFNSYTRFREDILLIFSATLLDLALKNVITFEKNDDDEIFIFFNDKFNVSLKQDESIIFDLLLDIRKSKKNTSNLGISNKDIENYVFEHHSSFFEKLYRLEEICKYHHIKNRKL